MYLPYFIALFYCLSYVLTKIFLFSQAVETRHALHGVTWPVSNPKALQVDFSTDEAFEKAKLNEDADNAQVSTIPGTVEDWLREQDMKRERGEIVSVYSVKKILLYLPYCCLVFLLFILFFRRNHMKGKR